MATMAYKSGGAFKATPTNKVSGAVGLIQFMPDPAKELLGTKTGAEAMDKLRAMTPEQQLDVVEKHLDRYASKVTDTKDLYMTILKPNATDVTDDTVLFDKDAKKGTLAQKGYVQNK